jgi:hypothetical protein
LSLCCDGRSGMRDSGERSTIQIRPGNSPEWVFCHVYISNIGPESPNKIAFEGRPSDPKKLELPERRLPNRSLETRIGG